jgi:hypothetical protein
MVGDELEVYFLTFAQFAVVIRRNEAETLLGVKRFP